ncbi:hypothetical protein B0T09DRAFT_349193, partial [Sordaria sp. MPI-SDFR-AT-0083]
MRVHQPLETSSYRLRSPVSEVVRRIARGIQQQIQPHLLHLIALVFVPADKQENRHNIEEVKASFRLQRRKKQFHRTISRQEKHAAKTVKKAGLNTTRSSRNPFSSTVLYSSCMFGSPYHILTSIILFRSGTYARQRCIHLFSFCLPSLFSPSLFSALLALWAELG